MSNKKKKKLSVAEQKAEKYIYYGTIIGLVLGVILGFIGFILTDNMFWIELSPLILLFVGLGIGAILGKNKNLNTNKKVVKNLPHKNKYDIVLLVFNNSKRHVLIYFYYFIIYLSFISSLLFSSL